MWSVLYTILSITHGAGRLERWVWSHKAPCLVTPPAPSIPPRRYLSPACCCTASCRCSPASSRTPTATGSTGRRRSPTPGSSRRPRPGRAPGRRTPARPAWAASSGSRAPTPPSRWRRRTWRGWSAREVGSDLREDVACAWSVCCCLLPVRPAGRSRRSVGVGAGSGAGATAGACVARWTTLPRRAAPRGRSVRLPRWRQGAAGAAGAAGS